MNIVTPEVAHLSWQDHLTHMQAYRSVIEAALLLDGYNARQTEQCSVQLTCRIVVGVSTQARPMMLSASIYVLYSYICRDEMP